MTIDLAAFVRPGDTILWGNGTGEPQTLTEALVEQRASLGGVDVFLGATFSDTLKPEHGDHLRFVGIGGIGSNAPLARAGVLDVLPCHTSAVPGLIESGRLPVDVVFVQLSSADFDGQHSLGLVGDYLPPAMTRARTILAEVNDQVPYMVGATVSPSELGAVVHTSRPPVIVPSSPTGSTEQQIGSLVGSIIPDGAVLQLGVGSVPGAIASSLTDKHDLSIHSGIVGDWIIDLMTAGVVTNTHKPIDTGITVTGGVFGTRRLYDFVHENAAIQLRPVSYTHSPSVLAQLRPLFAINSALQVDLTGQVNAETVEGHHIGAVGGHVDFSRAAMVSPGGRSIIALPSTARRGAVSRIVTRLPDGVVTTPRSDADLVVTEHGVADLRGVPARERVNRMVAIADPRFRGDLMSDVRRGLQIC